MSPEQNGTPLTAELLTKAMTSPRWEGPDIDPADAQRYLPYVIEYCKKYSVNTRDRFSAWVAQMGAESGSFKWWEEFGQGGGNFGNYFGRGPGQLTHEETYREFQNATGWPAHDNPDIVGDKSNPRPGFESCTWLWEKKGLNELADEATWPAFYEITHRWWGITPPQPVHERDARYDHAWSTLPNDLNLSATSGEDGDQKKTNFDKGIEYLWPAVGKVRY